MHAYTHTYLHISRGKLEHDFEICFYYIRLKGNFNS